MPIGLWDIKVSHIHRWGRKTVRMSTTRKFEVTSGEFNVILVLVEIVDRNSVIISVCFVLSSPYTWSYQKNIRRHFSYHYNFSVNLNRPRTATKLAHIKMMSMRRCKLGNDTNKDSISRCMKAEALRPPIRTPAIPATLLTLMFVVLQESQYNHCDSRSIVSGLTVPWTEY
jgi:hypothetical protein